MLDYGAAVNVLNKDARIDFESGCRKCPEIKASCHRVEAKFRRAHNGFTLVEMVAVVAMVGILATIALPSYQDYTTRARIPDATSTLSAKRVQIEQYYQDSRTYSAAPACQLDTGSSQYFDFSCTAADDTSFTLRAVGKGAMTGFTYTIDESSLKKTVNVPVGWDMPPTDCWVTNKRGKC